MAPPQNVEVQNAVKVGVSGHTDGRQHSEREREFTVANEKFGIKNATNVLGSMTLPEPTGGAYKLELGQNLHSGKSHKNVAWMFCAYG